MSEPSLSIDPIESSYESVSSVVALLAKEPVSREVASAIVALGSGLEALADEMARRDYEEGSEWALNSLLKKSRRPSRHGWHYDRPTFVSPEDVFEVSCDPEQPTVQRARFDDGEFWDLTGVAISNVYAWRLDSPAPVPAVPAEGETRV